LLVSLIKSTPGDLIDFNFQNRISVNSISNLIGNLASSLGFESFNLDYSINIYDIHYESTDVYGTLDTLSGLICIPESNIKSFPIIGYQHGTQLLDSSAPSSAGISLSGLNNNLETSLIGLITASSGFISILPDYEGLGNSEKFHPYIVEESYVNSLINMIRATKSLSDQLNNIQKFQSNGQLFLMGYSEGGYATLAVQKGIELNFSDEFQITASFPMAGPYDLSGTMVDYFLSGPSYSQPYYVPYVLTSHLWTYQGIDANFYEYFTPFWAENLPILYDGAHSSDEINAIMPADPLDILLPSVLTEFENNENHFFRESLQENTLLNWTPSSPTFLYHGIGDDIIPHENSQIAYDTFMENGSNSVNLVLFPEFLGGHSEVAITCLLSGFETASDYQMINNKGDLNIDGALSILDINVMMGYLVFESNFSDFELWAGDVNFDQKISILDLLILSDNL
jgi:hypothetical protein